jgi:hypothetical protein
MATGSLSGAPQISKQLLYSTIPDIQMITFSFRIRFTMLVSISRRMSDDKSVRKRSETLGRTAVQTLSFGNRTAQLLRGGLLQ